MMPTSKSLHTVLVGLCVFALSACSVGGGPASEYPPASRMAATLNTLSDPEKNRVMAGMVAGRYRNVVSSAATPVDTEGLNTSVTKSRFNTDPMSGVPARIARNVSINARYVEDTLAFDWRDLTDNYQFSTATEPTAPGYNRRISILGPTWKGIEHSLVTDTDGRLHSVLYSDVEDNDDADYLALGFWIWLPNLTDPGDVRIPYAGAAASGNDPFRAGSIVHLAGGATYLGIATGLYAARGLSPGFRYFTADVRLTADFDRDDIHGAITDFMDPTSNEPIPGALLLERDDIESNPAAFFRSRAAGIVDGQYFRGEWGGQFFGNGASSDLPGSIAGVFDAAPRYDPNAYLIGAFGAHREGQPTGVPERAAPPDGGDGYTSPTAAALNGYSGRVKDNVARRVAVAAVRRVVSSTASTTNVRPITAGTWNTGVTQASGNSDPASPVDNRAINARYMRGNLVFERIQMELGFRHHTINKPEPPGYLAPIPPTPDTPQWQGVEDFSVTRSGGRYYSVYYSDVENNSDTDYLALGYWAWIPGPGSFRTPFVGAAASGNDPFLVEHVTAVSGRATYEGAANGLYAASHESPAFRSFGADVRLTADFDESSIGGTITDGRDSATGEQLFEGLVLEEASIRTADAAFFGSEVRGLMNGKYLEGDWGGQFYGNGLATTDIPVSFAEPPGSVAGTFGATSLDSVESLLGVFRAYRE